MIQPLRHLPEVHELYFVSVLRNRMVDHLDNLLGFNPAVRMKHQTEAALLVDRQIDRGFPVFDSDRIIDAVKMLSGPVARRDARNFPAGIVDHVWIWIVLDVVDEVVVRVAAVFVVLRQVLPESLLAVGIEDQFFGQRFIFGCEEREDRGIDLQKLAALGGLAEDLREEPRADCVQ